MKRIVAVATFVPTLVLASLSVAAQTQSREQIFKELETKRAEIAALEKKVLAPSDADRDANAEFLSESNTGLIRLLPRETYGSGDKRSLTISGNGAFYSFASSTYEPKRGYDIQLSQGTLSVGFAGMDYGMILNVGDIPLHELTPDNLAVRALFEYAPATKEEDARKTHRTLWQGLEVAGFTFKNRVPAKVSNTYLLRSMLYDDSDAAVAFRITRQDTDGSLILIYKVLKTFPAPKAERTKIAEN